MNCMPVLAPRTILVPSTGSLGLGQVPQEHRVASPGSPGPSASTRKEGWGRKGKKVINQSIRVVGKFTLSCLARPIASAGNIYPALVISASNPFLGPIFPSPKELAMELMAEKGKRRYRIDGRNFVADIRKSEC